MLSPARNPGRRSLCFGAWIALLVGLGAPSPARASHADHPELLRLLDFAEYVAAEDSARALYERAPAGSEDEATGVDLFLRAARLSGRAPVQALLGLAQQILAEREEAYGPDDPRVADILHELGNLQLRADDPGAAAATHARALAIHEARGDSLDYAGAACAQALANSKLRLGELDTAAALYRRAENALERTRPAEPFRRAFAINGLGLVAERRGDLDRAQALFERALTSSYDPRVEDHPRTATIARNLGRLLLDRGEEARALESLQTAYRIRTRRLDPASLHLGNAAQDLARAEAASGELDAAIEHARQAQRIREAKLGAAHVATLASRELLVRLCTEKGDFAAAESALDALEAAAADDDASAADRRDFLRANLLNEQGDYARARATYETLLARRRARWSADDPRIAATLHNLSEVLRREGDRAAALRTRQEAVDIQSRALAPGDPDRVRGLVNLADLRLDAGEVERARPLLERAQVQLRESLGPENPGRAKVLYLLAECDLLSHRPEAAIERCREALKLQREAYGDAHAEVAWGRERLARAQLLAGEIEPGLREALRAARRQQSLLRRAVQGLAEHSALRFAATSMGATDLALATLFDHPLSAALRDSVYARVVAGRSLVLESMLARRREFRQAAGADSTVAEAYRRVQRARARLAAAAANTRLGAAERKRLVEERGRAEAAWARSLGRRPVEAPRVDVARLRGSLDSGSALLSFVRFDAALEPRSNQPHYAALLLPARGPLQAEDLGPASALDEAVRAWRDAVLHPLDAQADARTARAGTRLRSMLLDGLSAQLARLDELVVVPDGSLHEVAWEALPTASGAYWVEEGPLLRVVDHERALLEAPVADRGLDSTTVSAIFGDPDFGPGTPTRDRCAALPEIRFSRLPGTRDEVDELRAELPDARVYLGADATEAALRRVAPRAAILHLATHGFFLSADCDRSGTTAPGTGDTRGIGGLAVRRDPDSRVVAPPLLRAGLVLAGANRRGPDTDAEEDGILLADEILGLDLPAGAWVVLSACDTGVGQAQVGEGVLGLRRAFAIAGARTLVMSLWSVEDESTRIWMRELYRARFGEGASTAQAARLASRRVLASRRARGQSVHPFWWAAFVATGSD